MLLRPLALAGLLAVLAAVAGCSASGERPAATDDARPTREWDGIAEPVWERDAYGGTEVAGALSDIADTGAAVVALNPTWYVDDTTSSLPERDEEQTPTDESLVAAIDEAHRLGLRVVLKPHVDLHDDGDRAEIVPGDPTAWFERYREMIVGYAELAESTDVEMLSVGTELAGTMTSGDEWSATIAAVRAAYDGPLTYAANFDSYTDVPFWDDLDFIGIDAYFELVREPTTDVGVLVDAWGPVLDEIGAFAAVVDHPVLFTEIGYVSQVGSTVEPWNWEIGGTRSDEEQAAGYQALFDAVADRDWLRGVQWWMWDDLADTGEDQSLDYTPHGKPAEGVLRAAWSGGEDR